jgi:hypothetical protein
MHWQCHNCLVGWQGQFTQGDIKYPTIILEVAGSNNDINVLNQSPLLIDVIRGHTHEVSFTVNGCEHHMGYYLTDGIYPSWPVFMKGVHGAQ